MVIKLFLQNLMTTRNEPPGTPRLLWERRELKYWRETMKTRAKTKERKNKGKMQQRHFLEE